MSIVSEGFIPHQSSFNVHILCSKIPHLLRDMGLGFSALGFYSKPLILNVVRSSKQAALDEHAKAADAAAQRHLAFIDRLLADKESLAQQCAQQAQQLKVLLSLLSFK